MQDTMFSSEEKALEKEVFCLDIVLIFVKRKD